MNSIGSIKNKHILFLQGPMGTFFKKLDYVFRKQGAYTSRIGFNMGDEFFSCRDNYTPFRGTPEEWPEYIEKYLRKEKVDMIFLFGDCRYYQRIARRTAYENNIEVFVFEEGYLRPHYITLEKFGVNGFSHLPRAASFYEQLQLHDIPAPQHAKQSKTKMVISAIIYYGLSNLFAYRYPHYRHHRDFSALREAFYGIRGLWRKGLYRVTERNCLPMIENSLSKRYYFVPLQTHNDFQILQHSNYRSIEKFIIEVLESFAHHAPKETYLVFKHHPVDRGRKNYSRFILEQADLLEIKHRVYIFHDVYLPSCLTNALGTVTINSTVGLTSIGYGIPTITLGNAIYDIEGLTNKGISLRKFWHQHKKPDKTRYEKFRQYLVEHTQLNGSFYGLFPKELENLEETTGKHL
jgi:capsular polysaccharide export protein